MSRTFSCVLPALALGCMLAVSPAVTQADAPETSPLPTERPSQVAPEEGRTPMPRMNDEEMAILQIIFFEARGEPRLGKVGTFEVAANRVVDERFPDTFQGVIADNDPVCQWSFYCDGKPEEPPENEWHTWVEIAHMAKALYREWRTGTYDPEFACAALYFHVTGMELSDTQEQFFGSKVDIGYVGLRAPGRGGHVFYCEPGAQLLS